MPIEFTLEEAACAVGGRLENASGCQVVRRVSTDSRKIQSGDLFMALVGDRFDGHEFCQTAVAKGCVAVMIKDHSLPGISLPSIRVPDTLRALGDLASFVRQRSGAHVVGITGSVGKTTTKEFLRHAVSEQRKTRATELNENNLIGVPQTILGVEPDDEWLVLELGTDRPGEIGRLTEIAKPDTGIVTAIGESHLEGLGSLDDVCTEKESLLAGLSRDGVAIVPASSPYQDRLKQVTSARALSFGVENNADYVAVNLQLHSDQTYGFDLLAPEGKRPVRLAVAGKHQVEAATAAAAAALSSGLNLDEVVAGLQRFHGLPGRCEVRELKSGVTIIADHYNANPVSMAAAQRLLEGFLERRRVMVAGEMWELGPKSPEFHAQVGQRLGEGDIGLLIAVGKKTAMLIEAARQAGLPQDRAVWFETVPEAGDAMVGLLKPGDVVLVKGSRGMRMERLIDRLTERFGQSSQGEAVS